MTDQAAKRPKPHIYKTASAFVCSIYRTGKHRPHTRFRGCSALDAFNRWKAAQYE